MFIDLRSDTVTRPTPAMLQAMLAAPLGDDVIGDDPTVKRLEERAAHLLGKQAACFVPSGTMANQLAIRGACEHGDEIIAHEESHIIHYETGAPAALSGCMIRGLRGERGHFTAEDVARAVRPPDQHDPVSRLVVMENTHNRGGGSIWPLEQFKAVAARAHQHGMHVHLDGARLMNACVAASVEPVAYTSHVDTVSMCFSKGLGAPVGSVLAGDASFVTRARRFRKMFGGAMRQSGILAGAAIHALDHHVARLADDHANAQRLARGIAAIPGLRVDVAAVQTNLVYFYVDQDLCTAQALADALARADVHLFALDHDRARAVTHLDVSTTMIDAAIDRIRAAVDALRTAPVAR